MNGHVIPNTPIAVDVWRPAHTPHARLFFLSHAHSDHTQGLSKKWSEPIYCSEVTAKIVKHKFGIEEEFLKPLSYNIPHIVSLDEEGLETMTVKLIDANHCIGAAMFLFEGYFGKILYTGDFRYHRDMFGRDTILGQIRDVDDLYLDNTYCSPSCDFPSQDEAQDAFIDLARRNLSGGKNVVICTSDLGKEDLFAELAKTTKTYIQVSPERLATIRLLGLNDVFTADPDETKIRLLPRKMAIQAATTDDTVVITPTSLMRGVGETPYKNIPNLHVVPYSEHSSYSELVQFVKEIGPKRLLPIVKAGRIFGQDTSDRSDFTAFDPLLDSRSRMDFVVPDSVQDFMNKPSKRMKKPKVVLRKLMDVPQRRKSALVKKGIEYRTPEKEMNNNTPESSENGSPAMMNGHSEEDSNAQTEELNTNAPDETEEEVPAKAKPDEEPTKKNEADAAKKEESSKKKLSRTGKALKVKKLEVHEFQTNSGCKNAVIEMYMDGSQSECSGSSSRANGHSEKVDEDESMDVSELAAPLEETSAETKTDYDPVQEAELAQLLNDDDDNIVIEDVPSPPESGGRGDFNPPDGGKSPEIFRSIENSEQIAQTNANEVIMDDKEIDEYIERVELTASGDGPIPMDTESSQEAVAISEADVLKENSSSKQSAVVPKSKSRKPKDDKVSQPFQCNCELLSPRGLVRILDLIVIPKPIRMPTIPQKSKNRSNDLE